MKFARWLRSQRMSVSLTTIQERARMVGQDSQVPDFKASIGWNNLFLKRNNVQLFVRLYLKEGDVDDSEYFHEMERIREVFSAF